MKKSRILVIALTVFLLVSAMNAGAQLRFDADIPWLLVVGANLQDLTGEPTSASVSLDKYTFPLPYLELAYQLTLDPLAIGIGLRTYTLVVAFAGWPMAYAELNLKPIVLRAEIGGFAFFTLGLIGNNLFVNDYTLRVLVPDLQASFEFTDWFRAGVGVTMIAPLGNFNNFGWAFYVNARFAILFK
jgi:hypothetical protein